MTEQETIDRERLVFSTICERPLTRDEIIKQTGLKWSTAYDTLVRLERYGIVMRFTEREQTLDHGKKWEKPPGRPKTLWNVLLDFDTKY